MSNGVSVKATVKFPDYKAQLKKNIVSVLNVAAATMQTNRGMIFKNEGGYNGHQRWKKPLLRAGAALQDRGGLKRSIAPPNNGLKPGKGPNGIVEISGLTVSVGTKWKQAAILNYGGIIKPVHAKALKIPLPSGRNATSVARTVKSTTIKTTREDGKVQKKKFMFLKKVVIPPRDYLSWNAQDQEELNETVVNYLMTRVFK